MRRHPWLAWLLMLAPAATPATGRSADPARPVRLGVLAYRGADDARRRWQPTADYLTAQIPGHTFAIVPLAWDAIAPAVERHDVDFVATSPANYVALEALFGAARIATLVRERHGVICKSYGAIIFARADRDDIRTLKDLRGKTFRAADAESFGGWWMALRELLERDLDPLRDFAALRFGGNQDTVVLDVRDGRADAGTVRDDDLERMANEGQIDPATFRILNRQPLTPEYPFARSTRLYPEWPLATLKGTPDELAQEVAVALLKMPRDSAAARAVPGAGWTIPLSYEPVHECLKALRREPYETYGTVTFSAAARQYRPWLFAAGVVFALLLATTTYTLRLNRSLNRLRRNLAGNQSLRSSIRATSPVAAGVVLVVAALVLVGWVLEVAVLKQVFPGLVAMNPMTAVAFLLAGTGLGLLATGRRIPGAACGVAVAAVGLLKLGEVLLGWGVEVDRWLFRGSLGTNRMAPNTALNLLLSGGALVLLHAEGRRRGAVAQILALATAVVAMLALIGYCYSITTLYGIASFIPMALHTALTFCVLSLGLLHARPDRGLMARITSSGIGSLMARRLMITSIIIPLILGWLGLAGVRIGYYETDFGISLLVLAHVVFFMVLVWWNAGLIDQVDAERQRTDAALRASETFYHSLVESLPQEIVRKDRDGRLTFANQRFCEALGRPREAILGRTDAEILPPGWAERARRDEAEVLQTGAPIDAIEALETPDGATRYIQVIITPQHDSQGAILGTQGIFWDVTRIKEAEAQLRAQNQKLQEMARSERRAHDDLKQAQSRMVETAKLAGLGQMIAGVAHEINNPLSFVSNNVAVLQRDVGELRELVLLYQQADDLLDLHRPELLGRIRDLDARADLPYTLANFDGLIHRTREGLRRIQQIVKDLRVFARLDESELNEVDLGAGIESTVNIILGYAKKNRVHLELDLQPLPPVVCFPAKINQVVMNLLSNAIDACPEGGTVTVRARAEPAGVRIEVQDTGCGIPPALHERIFDPFFTTKPIGVGTGLGLSISYGIIQDHGGSIEVESAPGQGSRFTVRLPLRPPPRAKDRRSLQETEQLRS